MQSKPVVDYLKADDSGLEFEATDFIELLQKLERLGYRFEVTPMVLPTGISLSAEVDGVPLQEAAESFTVTVYGPGETQPLDEEIDVSEAMIRASLQVLIIMAGKHAGLVQ